ncbi:MAG: hypothetical protein ACE5HX_05920 [bacterium]
MKNTKLFIILLLPLFLLTGCIFGSDDDNIINVTGTVKFIQLEGGFFGIIGDNGKQYDPINLAPEYQQDGLRVRFEAKKRNDLASVHMWGILVEILEIRKL